MTKDGSKALALAYIDARDVMRRLDDVCGPENWEDSYVETPKGRVICTIAIRIGDEWVRKSDGAGDTDVEGDKGGISDAFKRAAVKWGIGRYLYDLESVWAECESGERNGKLHWKAWTANGKAQLLRALGGRAAATAKPAPVSMTEEQFAELTTLIGQTGTDAKAMCEHYKVSSLRELTAAMAKDAIQRLYARLPKKKEAA